jgi:hypothetical protein
MEHGLPRVGFLHDGGFGFQVVVAKSSARHPRSLPRKPKNKCWSCQHAALVEWHGSLAIDPSRTNRREYHWAGRAAASVRHISRG